MEVSVVIPTCNRKKRLLSLLQNLEDSIYPLAEVLIVDSGEDKLEKSEYSRFSKLRIRYLESKKSVCIQRNTGIREARTPWIFLCDDDIEIPADYLDLLFTHIQSHPQALILSGLIMQKEGSGWVAEYPIRSTLRLLFNYIFKLSTWYSIPVKKNFIHKLLRKYYAKKGNHIARSGFPVITDFSPPFFTTPVYGLGASIVKREWLLKFPYDDVLDSHGIGDNYGLAINFPPGSIHVLTNASAYHHQETGNRLHKPIQFYYRMLALDYFRKTNKNLTMVKKRWMLWSVLGNIIGFIINRDSPMIKAGIKTLFRLSFGKNPYYIGNLKGERVVNPV